MKYQKTINLDIENISSTSQKMWRSIYEVIHDDYFKAVKLFPTQFLDQCQKKVDETQNIPNEVKADVKWVVFTSGYDNPKGFR